MIPECYQRSDTTILISNLSLSGQVYNLMSYLSYRRLHVCSSPEIHQMSISERGLVDRDPSRANQFCLYVNHDLVNVRNLILPSHDHLSLSTISKGKLSDSLSRTG